MKKQSVRLDQLTFSRFLAAVAIVVFHYGRNNDPFNNPSISFLFDQANKGVSYFFVLSGFVMVIAYSTRGAVGFGQFIKNRLARIYPLYLFAIFLVFLSYMLGPNHPNSTALLLNILLLQAWIPEMALTINPPGWSLSVEFFFYAVFPMLLSKVYRRLSLNKIAFIMVTFWIVSQVLFHVLISSDFSERTHFWHYFPVLHLNEFLMGNLGGLLFFNLSRWQHKNFDIPILILVGLLLFILKYQFDLNYHNGLLTVIFLPIILLLSFNNGYITKLFQIKPFVFLGEISYGVYILQFPVWLWFSDLRLETYFGITKDSNLNFYVKLTILLIVASISYKFIESPLRNKIKKLTLKPKND